MGRKIKAEAVLPGISVWLNLDGSPNGRSRYIVVEVSDLEPGTDTVELGVITFYQSVTPDTTVKNVVLRREFPVEVAETSWSKGVPQDYRIKVMERLGRAGAHLYTYNPTGKLNGERHVFEHPHREGAASGGWLSTFVLRKRTDHYMTGIVR